MRRDLPACLDDNDVDDTKALDDSWEIFRRRANLPSGSREHGSFDPPGLVAGGFTPVLHTEPLTSDSGAACLSPAAWVLPSGCRMPPCPAAPLVRSAAAP